MTKLGEGRVFASHYQILICDDPTYILQDEENWDDSRSKAGFAGNDHFRMVGTHGDGNDHWVELVAANQSPDLTAWDCVVCVPFVTRTGRIHIASVIDANPVISAELPGGEYALYVACKNPGIDQMSLGENDELTDTELAEREDVERYRVYVVYGRPARTGMLVSG